jgi:GNAT superfamily N-acetyltransferase
MPFLRVALLAFGVILVAAPAALRVSGSKGSSPAAHLRRFLTRALDLSRLVLSEGPAKAWSAIRYRVYSDSTSLGLRRDLRLPFDKPTAKIPITIRPISLSDDMSALDPEPDLPPDEAMSRLAQRRLLGSGLRVCYVAIADDGKPCYMQWAIPATENERMRAVFGNLYPKLGPDEALLEGAYTPTAYRGKGIMGAAMAQVAERAADFGARWVITFVDERNSASVKGCVRAGFSPYLRRHEKFRLFYRQVQFEPIEATGNVS